MKQIKIYSLWLVCLAYTCLVFGSATEKKVVVLKPFVYLHEKPVLKSQVVLKLSFATILDVIAEEKDWFLVRVPQSSSIQNYSGYIAEQDVDAKALEETGYELTIKNDYAEIMTKPDSASEILGVYEKGESLYSNNYHENWFKVKIPVSFAADVKEAYISKKAVELLNTGTFLNSEPDESEKSDKTGKLTFGVDKIIITAPSANIRSEMTLQSDIIAKIPQDTILHPLEKKGEWFVIALDEIDPLRQQTGYIHQQVVKILTEDSNQPTLPTTDKSAKVDLPTQLATQETKKDNLSPAADQWLEVVVPTANIRAKMDFNADVVFKAKQGQKLKILHREQEWFCIDLTPFDTNQTGFIHQSVIKEIIETKK